MFSRAIALAFVAITILVARSLSAESKHFLWRVTNAAQPFYILGSVHALRGSDYPLGSEIDDAISQCRRFVFEYDSYHTDVRLWLRKMREAEHYAAGTTLREKVQPNTYSLIRKIARVRASEYDDVKPWAIACFMIRHPFYHDVHAYYGVESYVTRKAGVFSEFAGLETLDENIHVFSGMSDSESEMFLLQTFAHDSNRTVMARLVAAYKGGDTAGVAAADARREREAPYLQKRFITSRNAIWVPRIEKEIRSGKPTMIVVGARHLCGARSVIGMLQARGYRFRQL